MTLGWFIGTAACALGAAVMAGPRLPRCWFTLTLVGAVGLVTAAFGALAGSTVWDWRSVWVVGGEPLHLRLDAVSGFFLVLVAVIGGVGAVYARGYWPDAEHPESSGRGRAWWSALMLSMALVLLCSNGLHFLMAWEAFAVSAYFLITLERDRRATREAGWLYLAASHAGTLGLFAFFSLLASRTGSWDLGAWRERMDLSPLFWLALFGFGVKAGIVPLHVWLPSAHASAPSHVSAMMSGVAIKMGLYGIVRFSGWLPLPPGVGWVVLSIGAVSAVLGAAFLFAQNDLKRLLAYCSVENMGVILIGVGAGMLGAVNSDADWGRIAMAGALLHLWGHGLFKALLFLAAGAVLHATGTREMSRLGGLWRLMPWTAGLFAFGSMAISALPPLNGFLSEWLIYLGLFESASSRGPVSMGIVPAAIALVVTGALALAGFVKASAIVFLGAARTKPATEAHECGWWMRAPMLVLAGGCTVMALSPVYMWPLLLGAVSAWNPAWSGGSPPESLARLGACQVALAAVGLAAASFLWMRLKKHALQRRPTWDCGYAVPTARMQYTSGSFGTIVVGWFAWVLQPRRRSRWPRGPFPEGASQTEQIPETVLERVVLPVGDRILRVSAWVRRRQHGRLQDYLFYLLIGLTAVGVVVLSLSMR